MDPMKLAETEVTPALGGVVTWCVAAINRMGEAGRASERRELERDEALEEGLKALLRCNLVDSYDTYVLGDKRLSVERRTEIDRCYAAYTGLGGNGTGSELYRKIREVPVETFHGMTRKG